MEAIDESLLLLLRQGVESLLTAKRVFLAGKRLALMALEPGAEVRAAYVSRRRVWTSRRRVWASGDAVWTVRCAGKRDAGTVHRTRNNGARHGRAIRAEVGRGRDAAIGGAAIRLVSVGWPGVCGMRRLGRMRRGVMRGLGVRAAAVSAVLGVGEGERGCDREGQQKGSPAREGTSGRDTSRRANRDTVTLRRAASVCRPLSCSVPRHEGPSFSIERRVAPLHTYIVR